MTNPFSLNGKTILVTGASSGIGRATAILVSKLGAKVIITARNESRLYETKQDMDPDSDCTIIPADITTSAGIHRIVSSLGIIDGIVQCAGVGSTVLCKDITPEDINRVFSVNVNGPILLQQALLSEKKMNKSSSIVFIASKAADLPTKGNALYSASKGAIISYAKCLALELASKKIRVNCVLPAMVWSDFILQGGMTEEYHRQNEEHYPLKRYGQPQDIANLAAYLLSDSSSWMTGSAIDITGGTLVL